MGLKGRDGQMGEHDAHRQRMYRRFFSEGLSHFAEHEALEFLLYLAHARGDTNALAHRLIDRFGSLSLVLDAPEQELQEVPGIGPTSVAVLKFIPQMCAYYLNNRVDAKITLDTPESAFEYLMPKFFGKTHECLFLVPMDDRMRPLGCMLLSEGTANATSVLIPQIVAQAVRTHATNALLAHNHPRGLALPSPDDLNTTQKASRALGVVNIRLSDHIIVADNDYCSLRRTHGVLFADDGF